MPSPADQRPPYSIEVDEEVWGALARLPTGIQNKITNFWRDHLSTNPHRPPIGGVHRLKGEWRDFYQFDVDRQRRMMYRVDDETRTVFVDYLGNHPQWGKRSPLR